MNPRILVLSASVGGGHLRAAQAVELALREKIPNAHVRNLDVLKLTNAAFRKVYAESYFDLVTHAPHVLGYLYDYMDRPRPADSGASRLRGWVERMNLRKFLKIVREEPWDLIINTHFLPAEIIAFLKKNEGFNTPQFTVTTDFDTHRLWANQPCERYFTANEDAAVYLSSMGVPRKDIGAVGIPIHPVFSKKKSRETCLRSQKLSGKNPVVLQLAGGFGVGPIRQIFQALTNVERPIELVVICGRNKAIQNKLEKEKTPKRHRVKVVGFTDQIDEFMRAADIVVSKPGGLTTSEVLACGAAMAIVNPIPGQESRNSDFLLENGAAVKVNNMAVLHSKISSLLDNEKRLATLKRNARKLGRPKAGYDVVAEAKKWIKKT